MRGMFSRTVGGVLMTAALLAAIAWSFTIIGSEPVSEAASVSYSPAISTAAMSELGSAIAQSPDQPVAHPAAGVGQNAGDGFSWAATAGLALALLGVALVHRAITRRPHAIR